MYYIYVIQNENKKKYVGYTKDLKRRISEHNKGYNRSTKNEKWELVYYEAFKNETDARDRELKLKQRGYAKRQLFERIKKSLS